MYDHLQGAREQYFVQLLSWILLMYVCCVFVQYAAVCHYHRFVCVSEAPVRVRYGHRMTRSHPDRSSRDTKQNDGNDIRPHTAQTRNERTSTESILVTAQSTAREPPEDGHTYGLKHVGATSLKCF
jgi:hypothetical protein